MNRLINIIKAFSSFFIYLLIQFVLGNLLANNINNADYNIKSIYLIVIELLTFILLIFINFKKIKNDFIDFDKNYKEYLKIGFKAWIIGLIVMMVSNIIISRFIIGDIANNEQIDRLVLTLYPLYSTIAMILIGPFIEEMAFRLNFKQYINNKWIYYIITVLLFAGIHVINGISSPIELLYLIPYSSLAFSFAYMLDKTNNIFTSTVIHTIHNTIAILLIIGYSFIGG